MNVLLFMHLWKKWCSTAGDFFWNLQLSHCTASARGNICKHPPLTKKEKEKEKKNSAVLLQLHGLLRCSDYVCYLSTPFFFFLPPEWIYNVHSTATPPPDILHLSLGCRCVSSPEHEMEGNMWGSSGRKEMKEDSLPAVFAVRHSWQKEQWRIRNKT